MHAGYQRIQSIPCGRAASTEFTHEPLTWSLLSGNVGRRASGCTWATSGSNLSLAAELQVLNAHTSHWHLHCLVATLAGGLADARGLPADPIYPLRQSFKYWIHTRSILKKCTKLRNTVHFMWINIPEWSNRKKCKKLCILCILCLSIHLNG